jgi:hypothetical protein
MKHIGMVKNELMQDLLKRMLSFRPRKRMNIIEVVEQLEKIKNHQATPLQNKKY